MLHKIKLICFIKYILFNIKKIVNLLHLKFVFKLVHNSINCPKFIEPLNFKITTFNSRINVLFYFLLISRIYSYLFLVYLL